MLPDNNLKPIIITPEKNKIPESMVLAVNETFGENDTSLSKVNKESEQNLKFESILNVLKDTSSKKINKKYKLPYI